MILKVLLERLSLPFPLKLHICVSGFLRLHVCVLIRMISVAIFFHPLVCPSVRHSVHITNSRYYSSSLPSAGDVSKAENIFNWKFVVKFLSQICRDVHFVAVLFSFVWCERFFLFVPKKLREVKCLPSCRGK